MAFTPKDWQDAPSTSTPISAAALEDLETRLAAYADTATGGATTQLEARSAEFGPSPAHLVKGAYRDVVQDHVAGYDPFTTPGLVAYFDPERIDYGSGGRDSFQRANSTTVGTPDVGGVWADDVGDLSVIGNALGNSVDGVFSRGAFDAQLADGVFEWLIDLGSQGNTQCILRYQANDQHVFLVVRATTTPSTVLQLVKKLPGGDTQIGFLNSGTGLAVGAVVRVKVIAIGNVYRVFVDDVEKTAVGGTDAGSSMLDQTKMGFTFDTTDVGSRVLAMSASPVRPADANAVAAVTELAGPGVARQATVANRPTFRENLVTGARAVLRFDGAGDRLVSTASADFDPGTLICAVNATTLGAIRTIVSSSATGGITVRAESDGTLAVLVTNVGTVGTSTLRITAGRTHLIAVVRETDDTVSFWIDGIPAGATRNAVATTLGSTLTIGARHVLGDEGWLGDIGPVLIWDRALQGHELRRNMDGVARMCNLTLPQRFRRPSVPLRLPYRLRGGNLHPSQAQFTAAGSGSPWTAVWNTAYDNAWNQSSIDAVYNAGGNSFRAIGDVATTSGQQATYLARYGAMIDYAATRGMTVFANIGDLRHIGSTTPSQIRTLAAAFAAMCAGKANVIALEIFQEFGVVLKGAEQALTDGAAFGLAQDIARVCRANAPSMPLGFSDIGTIRGGLAAERERMTDYARLKRLADYVDYLDVHLYKGPGGMRIEEVAAMCAATSMPIILGEIGLSRAVSTAGERATYYSTVGALMNAEPQVAGTYMWAARTDNYGFVNEAGTYVGADIEPGFRSWPTTWT